MSLASSNYAIPFKITLNTEEIDTITTFNRHKLNKKEVFVLSIESYSAVVSFRKIFYSECPVCTIFLFVWYKNWHFVQHVHAQNAPFDKVD